MTTTKAKPANVIRRSGALHLLGIPRVLLDALELPTWKEGRTVFYDAAHICALGRLREGWTKAQYRG